MRGKELAKHLTDVYNGKSVEMDSDLRAELLGEQFMDFLREQLGTRTLFLHSVNLSDEKLTVTLAANYKDWREVFPKVSDTAMTEEEFPDFVTPRYVKNTVSKLKSHLKMMGYVDSVVIWEPDHLKTD